MPTTGLAIMPVDCTPLQGGSEIRNAKRSSKSLA
jgi:hypothetical protein